MKYKHSINQVCVSFFATTPVVVASYLRQWDSSSLKTKASEGAALGEIRISPSSATNWSYGLSTIAREFSMNGHTRLQ